MAQIRSFQCIRPKKEYVSRIAALPYDVYNRAEALEVVKKEPLSFLKIDRAETQFDESVDTYDKKVYEKARDTLNAMIDDGFYIKDENHCYYIYELTMDGRSQTGLVACASIDDYENNIIKKHENTRADKELDRINHVDTCNAQTGPIFLAYRTRESINEIIENTKKNEPLYHFVSEDGITHKVWVMNENDKINQIKREFETIKDIYIADGHHRAASAVKVGQLRRKQNPGYDGSEEFNFFLSVLFPDDQLKILPYNRVVKDLKGLTSEEFLQKLEENFEIKNLGNNQYMPEAKESFGMYLEHTWYQLKAKTNVLVEDPVDGLDVSILQNNVLAPILGIDDPRTDTRIDFIGGIRGLNELEKRVQNDMKVAFSLYPTSIFELFAVSDSNLLMPPKSTWFEPKLRSGLFIHSLE